MVKRFLFILFLTIPLAASAFAAEPEPAGSIRLTLPGGNLWLYQVATLSESGTFRLTDDFSSWDGSLTDSSSPETAKNLAAFVTKNQCIGQTKTVTSGNIHFSNLNPGLYLLLQTEPASGYEPVAPFLVLLRAQEDGSFQEIDATPKIQLSTIPTQPLPSLPQTGQQKLPVVILGLSGLILFLVGLALQRRFHG